jgi:NADPH2:quinone reductase
MRAVAITAPGGPEVLQVIQRTPSEPGRGQVRITVRAAAVNPTDSLTRQTGVADVPPPWIPGMDLAGVVESVGPGVRRLQVGDAVMAAVSARRPEGGAQAELVVVPEASAVPLPDGVDFAAASILPMNGLTARLGIDALALESGQTLAVSGGSGLLGSLVIGLGRELGWNVIANARPADAQRVRDAGATTIVPRGDDFAAAIRAVTADGVDGLFDAAAIGAGAIGAVRDGGAMVSIRGWVPEPPERRITVTAIGVSGSLQRTDWLQELSQLVADGRLQLRPTVAYPPERAAEAQRIMDAGGLRERNVIVF